MKAIRALLKDRRRSQRGSVLSAVLIIVAFLAIISGALMTELSTNFLLSKTLLNRVNTQATVNSAVELAINQLQATTLNAPCPALPLTPTLNKQVAVASYVSCYPTVDVRSPRFISAANSSQFKVDGTHAQLPGLNDYVVGDSGGTVFDFPYGQSSRRWALPLRGAVTAPPLVMSDPSNGGEFLDLIPVSGSACAPAGFCLSVRSDDGISTNPPSLQCTMPAAYKVSSQPAAGSATFPNIAYAGDDEGNVYAVEVNSSGNCDIENSYSTVDASVAGIVAFPCQSGCGASRPDDVMVLTSTGGSSQLWALTYSTRQGLSLNGNPLTLPWGNAAGIAAEATTLPSRLAISFAGGQVAVVQIDASGTPTLTANVALPAGIGGAPYWCNSCPPSGSRDLIGVGSLNGSLYLLDTNLNPYASYGGGSAISTTPGVDAAGNWYFAADDGTLSEVQKSAGSSAMVLAASFGSAGAPIGSSPVVAGCPAGICVYLGSLDSQEYLVALNARHAVLTACITTAPPSCSGVNPRLWTSVEVGVAGDPQTVHVQGWSYYSP